MSKGFEDQPSDPPEIPVPRPRAVTVLESVAEIRAQIRRAQGLKESIPVAAPAVPVPAPAAAVEEAVPYRPSRRPSMAVLIVLDDGDEEGEVFRIRRDSFVIGRVEGDLIIPHDSNISGKHTEIFRRVEGGKSHWYLRDLQSTNGTYVRVAGGILRDRQEMIVGGRIYRFEMPQLTEPGAAMATPGAEAATRKWMGGSLAPLPTALHPAWIELTEEGGGRRFPLDRAEQWVGRDPSQCTVVLHDPMVSPRHARICRDPKGRWMIQNHRSLNGLWMRIAEVALEKGGQFQCGEQRFLIRIL